MTLNKRFARVRVASPTARLQLTHPPFEQGRLNTSKLSTIFAGFGATATDFEIQDAVAEIGSGDGSGSSEVDFKEFTVLMTRAWYSAEDKDAMKKELKSVFQSLDADGDGVLNAKDIEASFSGAGFKFHPQLIAEMLGEVADKSKSVIALEDFQRIMGPAKKQ